MAAAPPPAEVAASHPLRAQLTPFPSPPARLRPHSPSAWPVWPRARPPGERLWPLRQSRGCFPGSLWPFHYGWLFSRPSRAPLGPSSSWRAVLLLWVPPSLPGSRGVRAHFGT